MNEDGGQFTVSKLTLEDLSAVIEIEKQSPSPWTKSQLEGEFFTKQGLRLACRNTGRLVGFVMARIIDREAEILKIATNRADQRKGAAQLMIRKLLERLKDERVCKCHLELRHANAAARHLYEKFDFQVTGRRKNYYTDPQEDAISMALTIR